MHEYRRVKIFRQSVQHHHQMAKTLESYDKDHPNPLHNTFAAITHHVKTQLPPILSAAGATATGRALMAVASKTTHVEEGTHMNHADLVVAFAALTDKHKKLVDGKKRESGAAKRNRSRENKRQKGSDQKGSEKNAAKTTATTCDFYCYVHGKQNSHTSAQCKVMSNDRDNFTAAMRNARSSNAVEGGSTAIKGKPDTQVTARGYMMTDVTDETESSSEVTAEPPAEVHEDARREEQGAPRTSFYDEDYCHGRRVQRVQSDRQPTMADFSPAPQPPPEQSMEFIRQRIATAMRQKDHVPDFLQMHIPTRQHNARLHDTLTNLMTQRTEVEKELMDMLSDVAADGTPLDPQRDIEDAYHAASARHNQRNRDMWGNFLRNNMPRNEANVHRPETTIYTDSSSTAPTAERGRKRQLEATTKDTVPARKSEVHPSKLDDGSRRERHERDQEFYAGLPQPAPIQ